MGTSQWDSHNLAFVLTRYRPCWWVFIMPSQSNSKILFTLGTVILRWKVSVCLYLCLLIINRQTEETDVTILVTEARNTSEILISGICSQRFYKTLRRKKTLMKTDAIIEKITAFYALFLSIHRISMVNSSGWTSNLLKGAESSQGINNPHWVTHGFVFGHTSSLAAPAMLSASISTLGFQVLPQFSCWWVSFPRPSGCPQKVS